MASTALFGSGTPDARERVPKPNASRCPFIDGLSRRIGPAIVSKNQKSSAGLRLVQILTHQDNRAW